MKASGTVARWESRSSLRSSGGKSLAGFSTMIVWCGRCVTCVTSSTSCLTQLNVAKRAGCRAQKCSSLDFIADEFGQTRVVIAQALEEISGGLCPP